MGVNAAKVSTTRGSGWVCDSNQMWNNTDLPLAYLITFRCYGSWLHGDERGSVDRFHNQYKSPYLSGNEAWHQYNARKLKCEPVVLDAVKCKSVEIAIRETCAFRNWTLRAINVRTNHVHAVVSIGTIPSQRALNAFKANATRQLRQDGHWNHQHSPWADKGSKRYFWNERGIERAVDYVMNGQGDKVPEFD
jgi:REP element-mobilizing transposase RayT